MKLGVFLAGLLIPLLTARAADDYEVRMHRPSKVGDRSLVSGKIREETTIVARSNGAVLDNQEKKTDVEFEMEVEAAEVDSKGNHTRVLGKIIKIAGSMDGKPITQLAPGDKFSIKFTTGDDKNAVLLNGQPAETDTGRLLELILPVGVAESPTDDEIIGTKARVKPGDSWDVNPEKAIQHAEGYGVKGHKPEHVSGKAKLNGVVETDGKPCMRIEIDFRIKGSNLRMTGPQDESVITEMDLQARMGGDVPIDVSDRVTPSRILMLTRNMTFHPKEAENSEIEVSVMTKLARKESFRALP